MFSAGDKPQTEEPEGSVVSGRGETMSTLKSVELEVWLGTFSATVVMGDKEPVVRDETVLTLQSVGLEVWLGMAMGVVCDKAEEKPEGAVVTGETMSMLQPAPSQSMSVVASKPSVGNSADETVLTLRSVGLEVWLGTATVVVQA